MLPWLELVCLAWHDRRVRFALRRVGCACVCFHTPFSSMPLQIQISIIHVYWVIFLIIAPGYSDAPMVAAVKQIESRRRREGAVERWIKKRRFFFLIDYILSSSPHYYYSFDTRKILQNHPQSKARRTDTQGQRHGHCQHRTDTLSRAKYDGNNNEYKYNI